MKMTANIDALRKLGIDIQQEADSYNGEVNKVYAAVDNLGTHWKGADNQSYVNKVNEYKEAITALGKLVNNYGIFLVDTAKNIERIQSEIAESAGRL
ncbi:MAG: WXG100 family type VII secretion target [Acholeplasmataceae bacterium]|jgi:uncharacterized protein YukE